MSQATRLLVSRDLVIKAQHRAWAAAPLETHTVEIGLQVSATRGADGVLDAADVIPWLLVRSAIWPPDLALTIHSLDRTPPKTFIKPAIGAHGSPSPL